MVVDERVLDHPRDHDVGKECPSGHLTEPPPRELTLARQEDDTYTKDDSGRCQQTDGGAERRCVLAASSTASGGTEQGGEVTKAGATGLEPALGTPSRFASSAGADGDRFSDRLTSRFIERVVGLGRPHLTRSSLSRCVGLVQRKSEGRRSRAASQRDLCGSGPLRRRPTLTWIRRRAPRQRRRRLRRAPSPAGHRAAR